MPSKEIQEELDYKYLEQSYVQLGVRIPALLRVRIDRYLRFMELPLTRRLAESEDWPNKVTDVVIEALEGFLVSHPQHERRGPNKKAKPDTSKIKPKR